MAADGTVNIDVVLHKEQAQQASKELDQVLKDTGKDAGDKAKESIENNVQEASDKTKELVTNVNRWIDEKGQIHIDVDKQRADESIEEFKERVKRVPKNPKTKPTADTDEATQKIGDYQKQVVKIPQKVRTELIAQAKEQGITNFDQLLKKIPKKQLTELVAKAQKGEAINYEELLKKVPARILTKIDLNDNASQKLHQICSEAKQTEFQFKGLKDIVKGTFVGGLFLKGTSMITGALSNTAHEALSASDAVDKFRSTMKLGGFGSEEIQRQSKEVQKYANETVYDLNTVANTTAQLASNGVKGYMNLTEAAGNLNAQAGGTADTFRSVAMVLTQTAGAGKLTTENWNQLTDAIPGASGVLQEQMRKNGAFTGNFRDAMAKGQITADEFNKAITQLGMNKGAVEAAKSTNTFEGAFGNLEAQVVTGIQEMIQALGKRRMTDIINTATDAVLGLTNFTLKFFSLIAEHKNIAIGLGTILTGVFATKKIADFVIWLNKAKGAMVAFGIASESAGLTPTSAEQNAGKMMLPRLNSASGALGVLRANKAVPMLTAAAGVGTELLSNHNTGQKVGGSAGSVAGTALGAFAGSFIGPEGTAVGAMAGEWLGKKIGETAGNAANKAMAGHSIVAHTKIKIDTDTSGSSKAIRPDLNKVARTVIKMDVDPKSISETKAKTDKLYSDMSKSLKRYYDDKEKRSQKDLQQLVKEGVITQQQANKKLQAEKDADNKRIKAEQSTLKSMQDATNNHYKRLQTIESGQTKKLLEIERKYGKNSKQYNQERIREIQKENQNYTKVLVRDQMKADRSINASIKKGAKQQEKIYRDLTKQKGKLSQQDLKQTQRDANKQYQATVRPAQKARDEVVKAAKQKYRETVKTAEREYKENHTISRKQYEDIVDNAKKQRDGSVREADRQYNSVTKTAREQHRKVSREIEDQKNEVNRSAMDEATGHISASQTEMQGVNSNYSSGYSRSGGIWNKFLNGVKGVLKFFQQSTKNMPSVPTGYATGTGALMSNQLAMVGEEGFELAHTPTGYEVYGANGPELRYLSAGTSILTHEQSKAAMLMNGGKLPGYAKGTGAKVSDFVDDVKDGFDDAMDLVGEGISEVWDWLKKKTGLDSMLNSQPSFGGVKRTTHGSFDYAKDAISKYIKKFADQFEDSLDSNSTSPAATGSHEHWMKQAGIPASWFSSINYIVTNESGWRVNATNPSSGAYGLPQSWPGSKMASAGADWRTNPITQLKWMKNYVTERYGGGPQAAAYWRAHHNYANGGWADKFSIFGEVPGEPEVAINPARDTSEDHIAEAIEARAKVNPNGFAGSLSKLIESAKNNANNLVPVINRGTSQARTAGSVAIQPTKIDGNMNISMNVDGKTIGHITYATWRAIRSHEINIQTTGGAVPVGGARPLGGVY